MQLISIYLSIDLSSRKKLNEYRTHSWKKIDPRSSLIGAAKHFSPWCRQSWREWWVSPVRAGWLRPEAPPPSLWLPHWWSPHQLFLIQRGRSAMPADYIQSPRWAWPWLKSSQKKAIKKRINTYAHFVWIRHQHRIIYMHISCLWTVFKQSIKRQHWS